MQRAATVLGAQRSRELLDSDFSKLSTDIGDQKLQSALNGVEMRLASKIANEMGEIHNQVMIPDVSHSANES